MITLFCVFFIKASVRVQKLAVNVDVDVAVDVSSMLKLSSLDCAHAENNTSR